MKQQNKEKLKDIIVDYIYDHLYSEKVKIIKSDGINLTIDPDFDISKDKDLNNLVKTAYKRKNFTFYYGERENSYCHLVDEYENALSDFRKRAVRLGLKKKEITDSLIIESIQFLCDKSFIKRNQPRKTELKLTEKGIIHYKDGHSFEDNYIKANQVRKAVTRSWYSIGIAIASVIIAAIALGFKVYTSTMDKSVQKVTKTTVPTLE